MLATRIRGHNPIPFVVDCPTACRLIAARTGLALVLVLVVLVLVLVLELGAVLSSIAAVSISRMPWPSITEALTVASWSSVFGLWSLVGRCPIEIRCALQLIALFAL